MDVWRKAGLAKITLFFFLVMLAFHPAYAQPGVTDNSGLLTSLANSGLPVVYLSEAQAQQMMSELQAQGYAIREGNMAQLEQVAEATAVEVQAPTSNGTKPCLQDKAADKKKSTEAGDCAEGQEPGENEQLQDQLNEELMSAEPAAPAEPVAPTGQHPDSEPPAPHVESHVSVGVQGNLSYSGGGGNHDFAKVFFIFAGIVMVAAFVVYAGKYIKDMVAGKEQTLWWELVSNSTFLDTRVGRHGEFFGAKLATGFVSDELIQLALVGEVGKTNLDLVLNEYSNPTPLNFSASYWMLGAAARLHLTDALVNASYLYLEMLGGGTSNSATDAIGAARFGVSFGINDHWRLGASLGAQYIGLDERQGFVNDGDNYWLTYGIELGARF